MQRATIGHVNVILREVAETISAYGYPANPSAFERARTQHQEELLAALAADFHLPEDPVMATIARKHNLDAQAPLPGKSQQALEKFAQWAAEQHPAHCNEVNYSRTAKDWLKGQQIQIHPTVARM